MKVDESKAMKAVYEAIGDGPGTMHIGQEQIQKYLHKRYKGLAPKVYKILVAPQLQNVPNQNQIRYQEYAAAVGRIFHDRSADDLKGLGFQLFKQPKDALNKETLLSEQDLFALIGQVTEVELAEEAKAIEQLTSTTKGEGSAERAKSRIQKGKKDLEDVVEEVRPRLNDVKRPRAIVNMKRKDIDMFHDVIYNDYLQIVRTLTQKRVEEQGYRKHKGFGKVTAQIITKKKSAPPEDIEESSSENEEGSELKIPEHFSWDKNNKLPKLQKNMTAYYFLNMLQKKDEEAAIGEREFKEINFAGEWPRILRDVCLALTGHDVLISPNRPRDGDDGRNAQADLCTEQMLAKFKTGPLGLNLYCTGVHSFRVFQGRAEKQTLSTKKELEAFAANMSAGQTFSET